jgi:hypothetical protein
MECREVYEACLVKLELKGGCIISYRYIGMYFLEFLSDSNGREWDYPETDD